ncbi:MAG: 4-hydroxy-tetrahydrodipicolinate reductase [Treponema sp.]|nr:4-hydroxy-tetrahydrodipicolinate reductase [Treponema sp.]
MKVAIIGYGKMGKMTERAVLEQGHTVAAAVDPLAKELSLPSGAPLYRDIAGAGSLGGAEVAVEFTQPGTALANIKALAEKKIPSVIGTTGWYDGLEEARQAVERAGTSLIWASNFSLGVNIFYRIAWYAAGLIDSFPEYDVGGFEAHHNKKLDSPSGTAKTLVEGVLARVKRKEKAVWETLPDRRPEPGELHYPSLRLGFAPGQHSLIFDSPADTIEITHTNRSREGLASGALRAAEWLLNGPSGSRKGFFTIEDMLKDVLGI